MARSSDAAFPLSLVRDKTFQFGQIRRVMWFTLFFIVQSTLVLGVFYYFLLGDIVDGTAPLLFTSEDMARMNEQIPSLTTVMGKWLVVMLLINAVVTTAIAIYVMRKLGNPILAMHRALNEIGDGNLNVRLRASDDKDFSELMVAMNRATKAIQQKVEEARAETEVLNNLTSQPESNAEEIRDALKNCGDVLSFFREQDVPESKAANGDS